MYKHLFGPVPSRRLGMSLGIDLVPHKICTFDCIYCECGSTTKLTIERSEYVQFEEIINELNDYFKENPSPDYITFSGAGEPTLNMRIGDIIKYLHTTFNNIPIAVITNGSLFSNKEVRSALLHADLILPSLDAAQESTFKRINKPVQQLSVKDYIEGLVSFRKEFTGKIWLEVMIIPGYNDDTENLELLKKAILEIKPDKIQLNSLDRPGVLENLQAADHNELHQIVDFWKLKNVEIIASASKRKNHVSYRKDIEGAILETISRRPCTLDDLQKILGYHMNEINKYLDVLESNHKIKSSRQKRGIFYQILPDSNQ
ncbi:radical SAM protein [candidate division KSB1 bacterium]